MTLKRFIPVAILALSLGQMAGPASAQDTLPEHYPESFEAIGTLNGINGSERFIVIDDRAIPFDPAMRVYTPSSRSGSPSQLKPGMRIGIKREHRREPVKEIWVMPSDR
jgi:hypothetical protein